MKKRLLYSVLLTMSSIFLCAPQQPIAETVVSTESNIQEQVVNDLDLFTVNITEEMVLVDNTSLFYKTIESIDKDELKEENKLSDYFQKDSIVQLDKKYTNELLAKTYYHIVNLGWVEEKSLQAIQNEVLSEELKSENNSKGYAGITHEEDKDILLKVKDKNYSVYSHPFNTQETEFKGVLANYFSVGDTAHITKYVETSEKVTVYYVENVGWTHINAFEEFATITHEEVLSKSMKIVDGGYSVFSAPSNTPNSKNKGTLRSLVSGNTADITKYVETSDGVTVYYVKDIGWVHINAFEEFATVVVEENLSKEMKVVDGGYSVFSQPNNTPNSERKGTLTQLHKGNTAKITKYIKTSDDVKVYLVDGIGWVHVNAFDEFATIVTEEKINKKMKIEDGGYSVFSKPSNTAYSERKGTLAQLKAPRGTVKLISYVKTSDGVEVYLVEGVGWVHINAFGNFSEVTLEKNVNETLKVVDAGYSVYSKPYDTIDFEYQGPLYKYQANQSTVKITKYAETSAGGKIYYILNIGWVDTRAFSKFAEITKDISLNKQMTVLDDGYSVFSEPNNTPNFKRLGVLRQYHSKNSSVKVTKYAETSDGVKVYYVQGTGWLDTRALTDRVVITKEVIKLERAKVLDPYYSVFSKPNGTQGSQRLGILNDFYKKNTIVTLTRYVETSDGVKTYYVSGAGWVDYRAVRVQPGVAEFLGTSKDKLLNELTKNEHNRYYLGTPYVSLSTSPYNSNGVMSPNGDIKPGFGPGMNCTGFVAYPLKKVGGDLNRITNVANAWGGVGNGYNWRDALTKNTAYYEFKTVPELLKSGKASKGDIIYFEPVYTDPNFDCHLGYFWGNTPTHDRIWHSTLPSNNISHIYSGTRFSKIMLFKM